MYISALPASMQSAENARSEESSQLIIDVDSDWVTAICNSEERNTAGPIRHSYVATKREDALMMSASASTSAPASASTSAPASASTSAPTSESSPTPATQSASVECPRYRSPKSFINEDYAPLFVHPSRIEIIKNVSAARKITDVPAGCEIRGIVWYHGMWIVRYVIPSTITLEEVHILHGLERSPGAKSKPTSRRLPTRCLLIVTNEFMRLVYDRKGMSLEYIPNNMPTGIVTDTMLKICQGH